MENINRKAGLALILGALLNITRIIPIILSDKVTLDNFPPHGLQDTMLFSQLSGWSISHIMALVSAPLLVFGMAVLASNARERDQFGPALMAFIGVSISMMLYLIAAVTDGFVLPQLVNNLSPAFETVPTQAGLLVETVHLFATTLAGVGAATVLITAFFLGITLLRGFGAKIGGGFGILLGIICLIGYATGFLNLNITSGLKYVGPLTIAMFAYLIATGVLLMRTESQSSNQNTLKV